MSGGLVYNFDRFNGIQVDGDKQTESLDTFVAQLRAHIEEWTGEGKRGLWLTLRTDQSTIIPQLVEMGFDYHHAQPGFVCLTKWLQPDIPNHLPAYANHYVGVAGFVVNSDNQVLAIQEQYHVRNNVKLWKLPGGLADAGEELEDTARREVFEETGVPCEFVCLLAFRHMHNYRHGCSDFYYVCLMRPLSLEIKPCPTEIAACQWIDLDEYEAVTTSDINKYFVQKYRDYLATKIAIEARPVLSYDRKSMNNIYSGCRMAQPKAQEKSSDPSTNDDTSTTARI